MRRILCILVALCLIPLVTAAPRPADAQAITVRINEFVASNASGLLDNTGELEDWIELHNSGASAVDLGGWTLTADDDVYTFPAGFTIGANDFLVLFASGEPTRTIGQIVHLPFKLSAAGEVLELRTSGGVVTNPAWPAPGYPAQYPNESYGVASGGSVRYFANPTPAAPNGGGFGGRVAPVTFSVDHGFHSTTQQVVLDTPTGSASIRYTTDGSTPSSTHGSQILPGTAITISSTTNLRAIAYQSGLQSSNVETRSYLFTSDIVTQSETPPTGWPGHLEINGMAAFYGMDPTLTAAEQAAVEQALTAIPTVSLTTDLDNLFDPDTGIWTNPRERGAEWERPVAIELIDPTGAQPGFEINGGLRVKGNSSRSPANFKHSMRLVFDDVYGDGELEYPVYGSDGTDVFESIELRTAQNWNWQRGNRGYDATWLRDFMARASHAAMGQPHSRSNYVHTFINGQYWGLYGIEERNSDQWAADYTGGNESDFDIMKRDTGAILGQQNEAQDGLPDDWRSLWSLVGDLQLTDAEWAIFRDEVDLVNLADYYVLAFWSGDSDGTPRYTKDNSNNWIAARNRNRVGDAAGWIFVDRDSESAFCTNVNVGREPDWDPTPPWNLAASITDGLTGDQVLAPSWLFEAAITQPEFVQIFKDRVQLHMLTPGGALTVPEAEARLDGLAAIVDLVIDAEAARWGDTTKQPGYDRADWVQARDRLRDCFQLRTTVIEQYLREDGLWPTSAPPTIALASGAVPFGSDVTVTAAAGGGTLWVTTDGADPRASDGSVAATAAVYSGPIPVTDALVVNARMRLADGTWSPLVTGSYTLSTAPGPLPIIVNEYNAVSSTSYLGGGGVTDVANGFDPTLTRVAGNGGDWFELVVIEDRLDLRGWTFEVWDADDGIVNRSAALRLRNTDLLSDLRAGTIITVSESIPDDLSYHPPSGDWHINLQANDAGAGTQFTAASESNFAINASGTQIAIRDAAGTIVALRTGEGTAPNATVASTEVFKLEASPTASTTQVSPDYNDGTSSTWGLPNRFGAGGTTQDLSNLRIVFGDVDCSNTVTLLDARRIAQYAIGALSGAGTCPLPDPSAEMFLPAGDVDLSGFANLLDARYVAQCAIGAANQLCPDG